MPEETPKFKMSVHMIDLVVRQHITRLEALETEMKEKGVAGWAVERLGDEIASLHKFRENVSTALNENSDVIYELSTPRLN